MSRATLLLKWVFYSIPRLIFSTAAMLVPKQRNLVAVFSRNDGAFAENTKYAYLNLAGEEALRTVFLTHDRRVAAELRRQNIPAVDLWSPKGILVCLRCSIAVGCGYEAFRGVSGHLLSRATSVQLWHGSGIKTVALDAPGRKHVRYPKLSRMVEKAKRRYPRFSLMYFPAAKVLERRRHTFHFERAMLNGLLRNDLLFGRNFGGGELIGTDRETGDRIARLRAGGRKLILFAPTWGQQTKNDAGAGIPFDLERFDRWLGEHDADLVIKLHPNVRGTLRLDAYRNIFEYSRSQDIYPFLACFDAMVSDISSIVADFALREKPIILYLPDLEKMTGQGRFSPSAFEGFMGERCFDFEDLLARLDRTLRDAAPVRYETIGEFHDFRDGDSGRRFVTEMLRLTQP